ncbi:MAG: hypothetical protein KC656_19525 [Myxococcales bacterium]|nr:hypothetical protein [Myxococcales bacterium]
MAVIGIGGRPFVDLSFLADDATLDALDVEITYALARLETRYTGGSHRALGIVPPGWDDTRPDYGEVLATLDDLQFALFASLGDPANPVLDRSQRIGEDGDVPLTFAQMRWLELAHGVYFPWKVYLELTHTSGRWGEKSEPAPFTRDALLHLPRTVRFVRALPFAHIGSVKLLGLMPGDDGTVHRDGLPKDQRAPDAFITFAPGRPKRLFVQDDAGERTVAPSRMYWFNDHDWHGVLPDPWFRYSIRVDGVFDPAFAAKIAP